MAEAKNWGDTYKSFSGTDMVTTFEMPMPDGSSITKVVGSLATISYSIHNEKMPVRVLGDMNMKNMVFNGRIIAGSMVFIVFDRHWLEFMMKEYIEKMGKTTHYLSDEIPPINITVSLANEYGHCARLALYGVTFVNEGMVMSVNDMYTENTFQYYAMDLEYLSPVDTPKRYKKPSNDNVKNGSSGSERKSGVITDIPQNRQSQGEQTFENNDSYTKLKVKANQYEVRSKEGLTEEEINKQFNEKMETINEAHYRQFITSEEKEMLEKLTRDGYKKIKEKMRSAEKG